MPVPGLTSPAYLTSNDIADYPGGKVPDAAVATQLSGEVFQTT